MINNVAFLDMRFIDITFKIKFPWITDKKDKLLCKYGKHNFSSKGGDSDGNRSEWCSRCDLEIVYPNNRTK